MLGLSLGTALLAAAAVTSAHAKPRTGMEADPYIGVVHKLRRQPC